MTLVFALLIGLELLVTVCYGRTAIKYFSSKYCPEEPYKFPHMDVFYLIWEGQVSHSALCRFTFDSGYKTAEICFKSETFDLYHLTKDVKVKITNNTERTWEYDRYDNSIPRTCVPYAHNLVISIIVPSGYRIPESEKYIKIMIDARKIEEDGDGDSAGEILSTIAGLIFFLFVACALGNKRNNVGNICRCLCDCLCYFIYCKCCPECNTSPCDCSLNDICQPCGECCSAWAGCCTSFVVRARQDNAHEIPEESASMTAIADQPESVTTSTSALRITGSSSAYSELPYNITGAQAPSYSSTLDPSSSLYEVPEPPPPSYSSTVDSTSSSHNIPGPPPPSYENATDMTVAIYTGQRPPPPNYEEVISQV